MSEATVVLTNDALNNILYRAKTNKKRRTEEIAMKFLAELDRLVGANEYMISKDYSYLSVNFLSNEDLNSPDIEIALVEKEIADARDYKEVRIVFDSSSNNKEYMWNVLLSITPKPKLTVKKFV